MSRVWRVLVAVMLVGAGYVAHADEVLYWMVDDPTLTPWDVKASEYTSETHPITDARIAAFKTTDTAAYQTSRAGGESFDAVVYLDLYFEDGGRWITDPTADPRIDSAWIVKGVMSGEDGKSAYAMASLETIGSGSDLLSTYSFAIELGSWTGDGGDADWILAAFSGSQTYAQLAEFMNTELQIQDPAVWMPTSYSVPEPTSGMLILIGGALLALKRKRV